jgi:hypothetical protein
MRLTYSHNNHAVNRVNSEGKYEVLYGRAESSTNTFREEVERAARLIGMKAEEEKLPVYVYMSGGQDSEVMARGFLAAGVQFTAIILQYEEDRNIHDIRHALDFCAERGIKVRLLGFNLHRFLMAQYSELAAKYHCPDVSILTHTWCIENLEPHFPVIGGGDLEFIRRRTNHAAWNYDLVRVEKTQSLAPIAALKVRRRSGATRFFSYTPELMHAYLVHPLLVFVLKNEKSFATWWEREWKSVVYHDQWDDIKPRQKFDGFEKAPECYPAKWAFVTRLNPVTDEQAAEVVGTTHHQQRPNVKQTDFTYSQLLEMVKPL